MAALSTAEAGADVGGRNCQQVTTEVKAVRTNAERNKNKNRKVANKAAKNTSLLMKLPAELRNKIWEFALAGAGGSQTNYKQAILIGDRSGEEESEWLVPTSDSRLKRAWRKPGLLRVSKQVREESAGVYYAMNDFHVVLDAWNQGKAVPWVTGFLARSGADTFDRVTFTLQVQKSERGVAVFFPIARLVFNTPLFDEDEKAESELWSGMFEFPEWWEEYEDAFEEIVAVAAGGKWAGVPYASFQTFFRQWAFDRNMVHWRLRGRDRVQKSVDEAMGYGGGSTSL